MRRSARALAGLAAAAGIGVLACTTTYTEADLAGEEVKQEADSREEEARDAEVGAEGGSNMEGIDEQIEWATQDTEL
jgi:hypothetical protein